MSIGFLWLPDPALELEVTHLSPRAHLWKGQHSQPSNTASFGGLGSSLSQMRKPRPRESRESAPGSPVGSGCLQRLSHSGISRQGLQGNGMGWKAG